MCMHVCKHHVGDGSSSSLFVDRQSAPRSATVTAHKRPCRNKGMKRDAIRLDINLFPNGCRRSTRMHDCCFNAKYTARKVASKLLNFCMFCAF